MILEQPIGIVKSSGDGKYLISHITDFPNKYFIHV